MAATIAQVDSALVAQGVQITSLESGLAQVDTDLQALIAKADAAGVPEDFTSELQAIQANTASLATATSQVAADDTSITGATAPAPTAPANSTATPASTVAASGVARGTIPGG